MKKLLLASVLAIAGCTQVMAADLKTAPIAKAPAFAPVYDPWTGPYLGVNIGYGWDFGTSAGAFQAVPLGQLATLPQGFVGGIQAGYGLTFANRLLYLGLEGDLDGAALTGSATMPGIVTADSKNSWLASIRPELGVVLGNALIYGTAGWGWGGGQFTVNELFAGGGAASINPTMDGFTWGGGVKFSLAQNWIFGVKYLQYDFGSVTLPSPSTPNLVYTTKDRVDVVRAELNYKF
jgi:outer membrane immunogenic protein